MADMPAPHTCVQTTDGITKWRAQTDQLSVTRGLDNVMRITVLRDGAILVRFTLTPADAAHLATLLVSPTDKEPDA